MKDDKIYNPELDVFVDARGHHFIKNEFNPASPQWLNISVPEWSLSYAGQYYYINWDKLGFPPLADNALKTVLKSKMRKSSPRYLQASRICLEHFQAQINFKWQDFSDITAPDVLRAWNAINPQSRLYFRELYRSMAHLGIGGARKDLAFELKQWKARSEVLHLKDVLSWNETRGALTSSEEKVLRDLLKNPLPGYENIKSHLARIFGWLLLDTLKRSSQILSIRKNGLREVVSSNGQSEWFVAIQPIKYQTGLPLRWWQISKELAQEIVEFSKRPGVTALQEIYDRLLVWDVPCLHQHGVISAPDAKSALTDYIAKRKVTSPRTKKPLHVTPVRIRHTGATRLAFNGVSRDIIQEILEHDSPESAQAYIDAVGSEIVPKIEKAGRLMGNIFYELNKSYFQGKIIHDIKDQPPIVVPEFTPTPLIVGVCSRDSLKDGMCPKHPFLSCYDGCDCFRAWDNPDPHTKALKYFEKEIERWEKANGGSSRVKNPVANTALETYHRAADAVREVLTQIKGESP